MQRLPYNGAPRAHKLRHNAISSSLFNEHWKTVLSRSPPPAFFSSSFLLLLVLFTLFFPSFLTPSSFDSSLCVVALFSPPPPLPFFLLPVSPEPGKTIPSHVSAPRQSHGYDKNSLVLFYLPDLFFIPIRGFSHPCQKYQHFSSFSEREIRPLLLLLPILTT